FSADAWNNVTFTAGETKDPRRNVPRSLALGTVIVIGLYVLANVAYLAALPIRGDSDDAMRLAAEALQAESTALTHEAAIKQLQSTIVQAQRLIARYENDLQEGEGSPSQRPDAKKWAEAEIGRQQAAIRSFEEILKERQRDAAEARKRMQDLQAQATVARGISKARDDRVGTAVLERTSPHFGVPLMALAIMVS